MVKTTPRVRMSRVWDDSAAFMSGHGATLMPIVLAGLVVPSIGSGLASATAGTDSSGVSGLLSLIFTLVTLWGAAAITALVVEPGAGWREAMAQGARRLLPLIGVSIALVVAAMLFALPLFALLVGAGLDAERMMAANDATALQAIDPARILPVFLYVLALLPLFLWLAARLSIVTAVVVAERNGLGAISRAWRLTRGHALRIAGVMLLYGVLAFIALLAVGGAAGAIGYLIGGNEPGLSAGAVVVALAGAALSVVLALVQSVFLAKLYIALTPQRTLEDDFA